VNNSLQPFQLVSILILWVVRFSAFNKNVYVLFYSVLYVCIDTKQLSELWDYTAASNIWCGIFLPTMLTFLNVLKSNAIKLRKLAPELFRMIAQDAIINYWMVRYRSDWCRHIAHVLPNAIQIQKNVPG
jgi:hypothetical protein